MRWFFLLAAACNLAQPVADPPLLHVTSPARSLIQDGAGSLTVTGMVSPNPDGAALASVVVNGTPATLTGDTFSATISLAPGATLVHTVATDAAGGVASDTRSVEAGQHVAPGSNIGKAIAAQISATAFAKIADVASTTLSQANLTALITNPIVHAGDPNGPDCLYAQAFVDSLTISGAKITLAPVAGGLQFGATVDNLDVHGHMKYAVACANGQDSFEVKATSATLGGVVQLTANGTSGFSAALASPSVKTTGLTINAGGIPQTILNLLPLDSIVAAVGPSLVQSFVGPLLNQALGALTAPQKLTVMGKTLDVQVTPSAVAFDSQAATVTLDMTLLIEGTETSAGFIATPNGTPTLAAGNGLALGIADDLANEALSELVSTGILDLSLPAQGDGFDHAQLTTTSPPMISANNPDGKLQLILPDMLLTFAGGNGPVAQAALNAQVELAIVPGADPSTVQIQLGTPAIAIDELDDLTPVGASTATLGTGTQLGSIGTLLGSIPLPKLAGLALTNTSVTADSGYVVVKTTLQ